MELTEKQRDVVTRIANGYTIAQVAEELDITPEAVRTRIVTALKNMRARNRPHLVALAIRHQQINPEDIHGRYGH